jgi:hypothetical protein
LVLYNVTRITKLSLALSKKGTRVKRKWVWMAAFLLLGGIAAVWLLLTEDRITQATYAQIRLGMTVEEVRALLGAHGIDVASLTAGSKSGPGREVASMQDEGTWDHRQDDNERGRRWLWQGRDGRIMIRLGRDGRVTDRMFLGLRPLTFLERLQALFGS